MVGREIFLRGMADARMLQARECAGERLATRWVDGGRFQGNSEQVPCIPSAAKAALIWLELWRN